MVITDETALLVDGCVAQLRARSSEMGTALLMYFLTDGNLSFVARQMDIDRKRVKVLVDAGIAWVDASLQYCQQEAA